jgi:uncharacterized repeat protein (TIGR02543 family)
MKKINSRAKLLILMAVLLVMMLAMSGCGRYRLTEDSFANTTAEEYNGMTKEDYDMRREEMGLFESVKSIFRSGKSVQQPDMSEYYGESDYEYDDYAEDEYDDEENLDDEEDEDDDSSMTYTTPGTSTTTTTRPSTSTTTNRGSSTIIHPATNVTSITVELDANGGSCSTESVTATYNYTYGYLPTPTYDKHEFLGWFTSKSGGSEVTATTKVTKKSDHTLYAHWFNEADKKYKITLDMNGGDQSNKSFEIKTGATVKSKNLPVPTRKNYAFLGWFTSPTGGKQVKVGSKFTGTSDMTLYAQWEKAEDYWSAKLSEANTNVSEGERVYYYLEYLNRNDTVKTTSANDKLYDFSGVNVADSIVTGETTVDDSITEQINGLDDDMKPQVIIKCIKDSKKKTETEEETMERFPGCEVIVLSNNAAEGTSKEKLFYSLWLSTNLYTDFGDGEIDIERAASELGVKLQ